MITPLAPGQPDYSSTGTSRWTPQIWSTKLVGKFYKNTVFAAISNTDYEGEIKNKGDKVIIRQTPEISIFDYQVGMDLEYSTYESTTIELDIDRGKYFAFPVEDVQKKQADINFINAWSEDAAMRMKIVVDRDILASIFTGIHAKNKGTAAGLESGGYNIGTAAAAVGIDKANVIEYIQMTAAVLSEQNVPESQRWIVIPGWMGFLIKTSDMKNADMMGDDKSLIRSGLIGSIDGYRIFVSNNFTPVADTVGGVACSAYHVPFGHPSGLTFAAQMSKTETLRNPKAFGDLIRGLMIYGYKLIRTESVGDLYCYKA